MTLRSAAMKPIQLRFIPHGVLAFALLAAATCHAAQTDKLLKTYALTPSTQEDASGYASGYWFVQFIQFFLGIGSHC